MKTKLISLLIATAVTFSVLPMGFPIYAKEENPYKNSIVLTVNSSDCYINGKKSKIADVVPTVVNGRTLVPARFLSESLGGTADWNSATQTASFACSGKKIEVPIGEDYILVDGKKQQLDVNSAIMQGRTMLPLRGICEAVGKEVDYHGGLIVIHEDMEEDENSERTRNMLHRSLMGGKYNLDSVGNIGTETKNIRVTEVDVPFYSDSLSAISGMYIDGLSIIEKDDDNYTMSFNVYNPHYTYGIAEVYDKDGNRLSYHTIAPYSGLGSGIVEYATSVWELLKGLYYSAKESDLNNFTVKNDAMTTQSKITCTVPREGSVFVTANPSKSYVLEAYNTVYSLMRLGTTAKTVIPGEDSGDIIDDIKDSAIDSAVEMLLRNTAAGTELISNFKKASSGGIDVFDMKKSVTGIFEAFLEYCDDNPDAMKLVLDILDVKDVTVGMVESAGISAITSLIPVISMPLEFWETSDAISVLTCVFMDVNSCRTAQSANFTFEYTVKYFYEDWEEKNFDTWQDIRSLTNLQWDHINSKIDMNSHVYTVLSTHEGTIDDFNVDINNDGIKEKISFCKESGKGLNGYCAMSVYINDTKVLTLGGGSSENPNIQYLAVCDININDGCGELLIGSDTGEQTDRITVVRYSGEGSAILKWQRNNGYFSDYIGLDYGVDFDTLRISSYGDGSFLVRYIYHTTSKKKTVSREVIKKYNEPAMWEGKLYSID